MEVDISHYIKRPFSGVARLISKDADTKYIKGKKKLLSSFIGRNCRLQAGS